MDAWIRLLENAGFTQIVASPVVAEAGLVTGQRTVTQPHQLARPRTSTRG
jgi:hypothetical protein